ncbi:aurora kinase A-interacting protein [Callorhinchus milii]|uniref:Small ribosomal subunit protein mS38 n=1 Tax=Callorhinchus milii TaxID=7868 RepID=V9LB85_CALMI|nr:aurora kinase A-interacting protein [Callorhinchus milii]|eukprot:gi/632960140/ref/XP_007896025.1/ PREDICTED: aurora kinase A-interacting protein [Callorhinchus milii]
MFLSRLTLKLVRISALPGTQFSFLPIQLCRALSRNHYVLAGQKEVKPQRWHVLNHELEEFLVPRKLSISPIESWLTIRYHVPKFEPKDEQSLGIKLWPHFQQYDCPPRAGLQEIGENEGEINISGDEIHCKNVLKIRRRKMNRHKYKKFLKRTKFLRRRIKEGRRQRRQAKFERDLKKIWKKAGLKKAPDGWHAPKIYVKRYHGKAE